MLLVTASDNSCGGGLKVKYSSRGVGQYVHWSVYVRWRAHFQTTLCAVHQYEGTWGHLSTQSDTLHTLVLDCGHDVRYVICSTKDSVSGCSATCVTSSCGGAVDCENSAHKARYSSHLYTTQISCDKVTFCHNLNIGESAVVLWNETKVLQEREK